MAKYMLIMRGTDESHGEDDGDAVRGDARDDRPVQRRADPGRRARRRRGPGRPGAGRGGRLQRRDAGGHRRPVRRDEGAVRRLLHARRGLEGGGGRVGQAAARRSPARSARSAGCRASTSSRRTTSGSSRSGRGASGPASSDARRPPAARRAPSRRGGPSRRSGGSSRRGSSARSPATPATSSSPRTSRRRRWPRRSSPGRATARRPTRWAGCSRPRGGGRSTASAAGPPSTSGTPCSPASSPRARQLGRGDPAGPVGRPAVGSRPDRRRRPRADVRGLPSGARRPRPGWP